MKPDRRWWMILLLLASPALSQDMLLAGDGNNSLGNVSWILNQETVAPLRLASDGQAPSPQQTRPIPERPYGWNYALYPAMAWAPIFGVSVTLPPAPSNPIAPPSSGSTNNSFNGAYFGGVDINRNKWSADCLFMWAALSASRTTPHTNVGLDFVFGDAMVGYKILPNLSLEGGFRRLALNINATVLDDSASRSPGYWDPLIGLTYRRQFGNKWRMIVHGDGGGFGVGSDVDVAITGRADWQFARHYGITMGYGGMHFRNSDTVAGQTLTISPTMHGPIFGFGFFF
jgi:hypothetical protein